MSRKSKDAVEYSEMREKSDVSHRHKSEKKGAKHKKYKSSMPKHESHVDSEDAEKNEEEGHHFSYSGEQIKSPKSKRKEISSTLEKHSIDSHSPPVDVHKRRNLSDRKISQENLPKYSATAEKKSRKYIKEETNRGSEKSRLKRRECHPEALDGLTCGKPFPQAVDCCGNPTVSPKDKYQKIREKRKRESFPTLHQETVVRPEWKQYHAGVKEDHILPPQDIRNPVILHSARSKQFLEDNNIKYLRGNMGKKYSGYEDSFESAFRREKMYSFYRGKNDPIQDKTLVSGQMNEVILDSEKLNNPYIGLALNLTRHTKNSSKPSQSSDPDQVLEESLKRNLRSIIFNIIFLAALSTVAINMASKDTFYYTDITYKLFYRTPPVLFEENQEKNQPSPNATTHTTPQENATTSSKTVVFSLNRNQANISSKTTAYPRATNPPGIKTSSIITTTSRTTIPSRIKTSSRKTIPSRIKTSSRITTTSRKTISPKIMGSKMNSTETYTSILTKSLKQRINTSRLRESTNSINISTKRSTTKPNSLWTTRQATIRSTITRSQKYSFSPNSVIDKRFTRTTASLPASFEAKLPVAGSTTRHYNFKSSSNISFSDKLTSPVMSQDYIKNNSSSLVTPVLRLRRSVPLSASPLDVLSPSPVKTLMFRFYSYMVGKSKISATIAFANKSASLPVTFVSIKFFYPATYSFRNLTKYIAVCLHELPKILSLPFSVSSSAENTMAFTNFINFTIFLVNGTLSQESSLFCNQSFLLLEFNNYMMDKHSHETNTSSDGSGLFHKNKRIIPPVMESSNIFSILKIPQSYTKLKFHFIDSSSVRALFHKQIPLCNYISEGLTVKCNTNFLTAGFFNCINCSFVSSPLSSCSLSSLDCSSLCVLCRISHTSQLLLVHRICFKPSTLSVFHFCLVLNYNIIGDLSSSEYIFKFISNICQNSSVTSSRKISEKDFNSFEFSNSSVIRNSSNRIDLISSIKLSTQPKSNFHGSPDNYSDVSHSISLDQIDHNISSSGKKKINFYSIFGDGDLISRVNTKFGSKHTTKSDENFKEASHGFKEELRTGIFPGRPITLHGNASDGHVPERIGSSYSSSVLARKGDRLPGFPLFLKQLLDKPLTDDPYDGGLDYENGDIFQYSSSYKRATTMQQMEADCRCCPRKSLYSSFTIHDFWEFAETTLINMMYDSFWYNYVIPPNHKRDDDKKYFFENQMLGLPRLRQVRVRNDSCFIHPGVSRFFDECYGYYSLYNEETRPIKEGMTGTVTETAWKYTEYSELESTYYWGLISIYGGGGYYLDLSKEVNLTIKMIKELKDKNWITKATRAVFVDFTIYNVNVNLFCICKIAFEFPPSGGMIPRADFTSVQLIRYLNTWDFFILGLELFLIIMTIFFTVELIITIMKLKLEYFKMFWSYIDIIVIILLYTFIGYSIARYIIVEKFIRDLPDRFGQHVEFTYIRNVQIYFNYLIAALVFFVWIRFIKFLTITQTMTEIHKTVRKSIKDILGFTLLFFIVFFAFAVVGFLIFGSQLQDYSTVFSSCMTLLQAVVGDFHYRQLEEVNRIIAPMFFILFVFFIFFIFLNIFHAIIYGTFVAVKTDHDVDQLKKEKIHQRVRRNIISCLLCGLDKKFRKKNDEEETYAEVYELLKRSGFTDPEIIVFFDKYHIDLNQVMNETENKRIINDLELRGLDFSQSWEEAELDEMRRRIDRLTDRVQDLQRNLQPVLDKIDLILNRLSL